MPKEKMRQQEAKRPPTPSPMRHPTYLPMVDEIRARQRSEGNFDCFGRAIDGYCDQWRCLFRQECLDVSHKLDA